MEQKKSVVLNVQPLEEYVYQNKTYYPFGIGFKNGDKGTFYSTTKEQTYFIEAHEVVYLYEANAKEPKKSKIKMVDTKTAQTTTQANNVTEQAKNTLKTGYKDDIDKYIAFKKIDAVSFSASYAKDIVVANNKPFAETADEILKWTLEQFDKIK